MKILEWHELEDGKFYLMHDINSGDTRTCKAFVDDGEIEVWPHGDDEEYPVEDFVDHVYVEIEIPSRSDWALAILQKDAK